MAVTPGAGQESQLAEVRRLRLEGIKAAKDRRHADAQAFYRQALRLHEQALGEDDPGIMESLGALPYDLCRHGRYAEAGPLIDRCLILLRQKPRPEHRRILGTLDRLTEMCRERGDYGNATQCHKRVLAAREELLGPDHPRVASTKRAYAMLLQEAERAEAMRGK